MKNVNITKNNLAMRRQKMQNVFQLHYSIFVSDREQRQNIVLKNCRRND